ncbi:MAG: hypothetical protein GWO81_01960 [Verrucomicrobia bacterium]|nr:hypothetical protein [Verrucomicrobiota bacterium]
MIFASMNQVTYSGLWTRHASHADAMGNVNSTDTGTVPLRDFNYSFDSRTQALGLWTFYNAKDSSGGKTPYNISEGFIQIYEPANSNPTSINTVQYNYSGTKNETLNLTINGMNALGADYDQDNKKITDNDYCRAGVGTDNSAGSINGDSGDWLSYTLDLDYTGTLSADQKFFSVTDVSGTLSILFQHDDPRHTALNGFYRIDLTLTDENSWAVANNSPELKDTNTVITVPEPSAFALLLAMGASVMVLIGRKP